MLNSFLEAKSGVRAMDKGKKSMKQTMLRSMLLTLAACTVLLLAAAWPAIGISSTTSGSDVHLFCGDVYWASYADYEQRLLTVKYDVSNNGPGAAYNTTMVTADANAGVSTSTAIPIWMGDRYAGESDNVAIKWLVPPGVPSFRTTLSICSGCSPNLCVDGVNGGIDIKPGSCPNPINIGQGNAEVAVAVFSYGGFDARTLDDSTVVFAGASPVNVAQEDKNGDGRLDMLYHFRRNDLVGLQLGDSRACLSAAIEGGGTYRSCDMVIVL